MVCGLVLVMTAVPGEPSPLRLRSSFASRAGTWVVTSINGIGSFDFRTAGSSAAGVAADRLPARIPTQRVKLARITRRIDRAASKAETPIGRARTVTAHNFEVLARGSDSSPVAEHKMTESTHGSPKLLWRGATAMTRTLGDSRARLISVAQHISKSVARVRPDGMEGAGYSRRRR